MLFSATCLLFLIAMPIMIVINYKLKRVVEGTSDLTFNQVKTAVDMGRYTTITYAVIDIIIAILAVLSIQFDVIIASVIFQIIFGFQRRAYHKRLAGLADNANAIRAARGLGPVE